MTWVEDDHWTAILDGIGELKDLIGDTGDGKTETLDASDSLGLELLVGDQQKTNVQDTLAAVPPRPIADRLVSQFLKSVEIAPMVIHIPTFLKEYEAFWEHQAQTPILWVGLLFAIMCLAVLRQQSGFEPPSHPVQDKTDTGALYRNKITECLVLGNYTKPSRYAIETLLLYMHVEYVRSQDAQTGCLDVAWNDYTTGITHGLSSRWFGFLISDIALPRGDASQGLVHHHYG